MLSFYYIAEKTSHDEEGKNKMEAKIKRIYTTHYIFLFVTQLFSLIFFSFILDLICSQRNEKKNIQE